MVRVWSRVGAVVSFHRLDNGTACGRACLTGGSPAVSHTNMLRRIVRVKHRFGVFPHPYGGAADRLGDALESLQCVLPGQGRLTPVLRSGVLCAVLERIHHGRCLLAP